jgi:hypothetical protein
MLNVNFNHPICVHGVVIHLAQGITLPCYRPLCYVTINYILSFSDFRTNEHRTELHSKI